MCLNKRYIGRHVRESHAPPHNFHAFTLVELLVVVAIVAIVFAMIPMATPRAKGKARRIKCVNNLKNVGLAFRIYASDHMERFPWELSDQNGEIRINYSSDPTTYIRAVTDELSIPKIVNCPADTRFVVTNWSEFSRTNLSYFISPDASTKFPNSFMAGDRNITNINGRLRPGLRALSTNAVVGWDETIHQHQGNTCMGDGSVQQLSGARLREQLSHTGQTNKSIKLSVP